MNLDEKPKPTDDIRRLRFLSYFRRLADMYGLKDWTIEMGNEEPTDKGAEASAFFPAGQKLVWMRLSQYFIDASPQQQRLAVVHELTHCHLYMRYGFAHSHIQENLRDTHTTLEEYSIDAISRAIVHHFPLPTNEERGCIG